MAKLTYNPNPTFEHTVKITLPDGKQGELPFIFHHKKMSELDEMGKAENLTDAGFLLKIAKGWGFKEHEFNNDNITEFFDNYPGAAFEIFTSYRQALLGIREKNS
ncbi:MULTISPECIES: phage tail assembly chaperone [Providencia]|uniref:phage tail assembly chaperone n=1 Tax=Providencia TaxID=586 RepID=UPI0013A74107|nr:phage tail assembly chaperone [Providencia vermicola]QIC15395.1 hypothetical protein G3341_06595 [Providencia vermicola]